MCVEYGAVALLVVSARLIRTSPRQNRGFGVRRFVAARGDDWLGSVDMKQTTADGENAKTSKSFPLLAYGIALLLILVFAIAPLGSLMIASAVANAHGCTLDEGGVHPCFIGGVDRGSALETMFVLGWLMLITVPVGGVAFLLWLVVLILHRLRWSSVRRTIAGVGVAACLCCAGAVHVHANDAPSASPVHQQTNVMSHATGTFDVKLNPQASDAPLGRMSIDKQFHGDLEATSKGEMLAAMTAVKESAGYVALEKVTGTLAGRHGSFSLQHSGTMNRGVPQLSVTVVPDSGTEELQGLTGKMTIDVADAKHSYSFEYTLPEKR